jgi:hypothetical protein
MYLEAKFQPDQRSRGTECAGLEIHFAPLERKSCLRESGYKHLVTLVAGFSDRTF